VRTETPAPTNAKSGPLLSCSGQALTRSVTFQFALDPTLEQRVLFAKCAGARRYCFNHHLSRVKDNLELKTAERAAKSDAESLTPGLSWRAFSFINEFNAWKNGHLETSLTSEGGERGLHWLSRDT
jgi:hypothetical protein